MSSKPIESSVGFSSPLVGADGVYRGDIVRLYLEVGDASTGNQLLEMPYSPANVSVEGSTATAVQG
jgi:hypothetical protein